MDFVWPPPPPRAVTSQKKPGLNRVKGIEDPIQTTIVVIIDINQIGIGNTTDAKT